MKEMKFMTMTKREFTNTAKRYAKKYWDITLDIPIKWENHTRTKSYAWCNYLIRYNTQGKIIKREPTEIIMNILRLSNFNDEQLLDILKHELTHWACMKRNKPSSDGTKFFEKELLRVGATSSGFDQHDKDIKEKSIEFQKKIIEGSSNIKTKQNYIEGHVSNISIHDVYRRGCLMARYNEKNQEWDVLNEPGLQHYALRNEEWIFFFTFLVNDKEATGFIAQTNNGKWSMAQDINRRRPKIFCFNSGEQINLSPKIRNKIRKEAISNAEKLLFYLTEKGMDDTLILKSW